MKKSRVIWGIFIVASVILLGSAFRPAAAGNAGNDPYIIIFNANAIPMDIDRQVSRAGGTVTKILPQIGVVVATSGEPDFAPKASRIRGVMTAVQDQFVQWVNPQVCYDEGAVRALHIGQDESLWGLQWAPVAIHAPDAWDAGATGAGVRVAILDGGIASNHPDLVDNIDFSASTSFVPGAAFDEEAVDAFWHGSHVAGIVAAEDNGFGTIGIAPQATIIGVKVLHGGSGYFSWLIEGILYVADYADADIINMSLGAVFPRNNRDIAQLNSALGRAMNYAYQAGVTIVASAGNNAADFDHVAYYISIPAEAQHVICVSATGPLGFAFGETNFDRPASYTNFGKSLVDFAAPGGDFALYPSAGWYYDMVLSPTYVDDQNVSWYSWASGTSQAAPHVCGVAALIIGAHGGSMHPAQVKAILQQSADDLGKPGNDEYYGMGRINAFKAVTIK
jgi:subtilisin family serine protease